MESIKSSGCRIEGTRRESKINDKESQLIETNVMHLADWRARVSDQVHVALNLWDLPTWTPNERAETVDIVVSEVIRASEGIVALSNNCGGNNIVRESKSPNKVSREYVRLGHG